jgi:hypothetical protein
MEAFLYYVKDGDIVLIVFYDLESLSEDVLMAYNDLY